MLGIIESLQTPKNNHTTPKTRVVPVKPPHRFNRGDESVKYDKTLTLGKTIVHIVNPPEKTIEEIEQIIRNYHTAGWAIIDELEDSLVNSGIEQSKK